MLASGLPHQSLPTCQVHVAGSLVGRFSGPRRKRAEPRQEEFSRFCTDQLETSTSPPPGKPRAFELLKIGSFKFPPPRAQMVFKCPTLSSDLSVKCPS